MAKVFSQKYSSTYMGNGGIYSVGTDSVYQKWQFSKIECFTSISREGLTCETLAKTSCLHPVLTLRIPVMRRAYASFRKMLSRELPAKIFSLLFAWVFTHSLSLTQPLQINPTWNKGYIKLNTITIKFGTELKPTKT